NTFLIEVNDYQVKCLNNLAAAQLKLGQSDEALHTSRDVLFLDPQNVKALFRKGKLLSDKGEYEEAMENLKKALKLEPSTKSLIISEMTEFCAVLQSTEPKLVLSCLKSSEQPPRLELSGASTRTQSHRHTH
uniref:FKBP prolyl isomerase 16 n=1 Tax=Sinocyclocheilus anshuiensis TaxID=1608454 RepID=A0A671K0V4_9TELE